MILPFLGLLKRHLRTGDPPPVVYALPQLHALCRRLGVRGRHTRKVRRPSPVPPHKLELRLLQPVLHLGAFVPGGAEVLDVHVVAEEAGFQARGKSWWSEDIASD